MVMLLFLDLTKSVKSLVLGAMLASLIVSGGLGIIEKKQYICIIMMENILKAQK